MFASPCFPAIAWAWHVLWVFNMCSLSVTKRKLDPRQVGDYSICYSFIQSIFHHLLSAYCFQHVWGTMGHIIISALLTFWLVILCHGGCSVQCWIFNINLDLYPLEVSSTPCQVVTTKDVSRCCQMSLKAKSPSAEKHWSSKQPAFKMPDM